MAFRRKKGTNSLKVVYKNSFIGLGLLLVVILLSFFHIAPRTASSPMKEAEKVVKMDAANLQQRQIKSPLTNSKNTNEKIVYLTFDDGPTSATGEILNILQGYDAKATFFMLSTHMKEHPHSVKRMVEDGHAVGLHGVTHDVHRFYKSQQTVLGEMNEAQKILETMTGVHSLLIRTPYGSVPYLTEPFRKALNSEGYKFWDWTIDSNDWDLSEGTYVENVIQQIQQWVGSGERLVVLLHDQAKTAKYLPKLLTYLTQQGFVLKKLDAALEPYQFRCYNRCYRLDSQNT